MSQQFTRRDLKPVAFLVFTWKEITGSCQKYQDFAFTQCFRFMESRPKLKQFTNSWLVNAPIAHSYQPLEGHLEVLLIYLCYQYITFEIIPHKVHETSTFCHVTSSELCDCLKTWKIWRELPIRAFWFGGLVYL